MSNTLTPPTIPAAGNGTSGLNVNDIITSILGSGGSTSQNSGVTQTQQGVQNQQNTTTNQTQNTTSQTGSTTAGTSSLVTNASGQTQSLSNPAIADIQSSLDTASSSYSPADLSSIATRIQGVNDTATATADTAATFATGLDSTLNAQNAQVVAAQKQTLDNQIKAQITQLSEQAGSSFNSDVQDAFARDEGQAAVTLAGLQAQLQQANAAQATQAMSAAVTSLDAVSSTILNTEGQIPALAAQIDSTRTSSIANLAAALKGAITTTSSTSDTEGATRNETQTTVNSIQQTSTDQDVNQNVNTNTTVANIGQSATQTPTTLTGIIQALGSLNTGS